MEQVIFIKKPYKFVKEGITAVDMHSHTNYSYDGISNIKTVVKKAKKLGIGFAVTDHNTIKGVLKLKNEKDVLIIPGIEITSYEGIHSILYFYSLKELEYFYNKEIKHISNNPFFTSIKIKDLFDTTKNYNCLLSTPHPFAPFTASIKNIEIDEEMLKAIKLVEVINGINIRKRNIKAFEWSNTVKKGITAGSDSHTVGGLGKVLTFSYSNDVDSFLKSLLKRTSWVMGNEDSKIRKIMTTIFKETSTLTKNLRDKNEINRIKFQLRIGTRYAFRKLVKKRMSML
jgi:predicted metal-dependent phosphoesterase TrpH